MRSPWPLEGGAIGDSLAIVYVMDSSENPEVAHENLLYLVTGVASGIAYFGCRATPEQICDYPNDWRP